MGATATVEIDTAVGADAQTVYERTLAINKELKDKEDDKVCTALEISYTHQCKLPLSSCIMN